MRLKRFMAFLLAAAALFALSGCGAEKTAEVDIDDFYAQLDDSYGFSELMDMDAAALDAFYPGLTELAPEKVIARMPMMTSVVSELVIVACKSAEDAQKAAEILNARVSSQAAGGAWYPESVALWAKARVETNGRYALLIAHDKASAIADSFNALFTK